MKYVTAILKGIGYTLLDIIGCVLMGVIVAAVVLGWLTLVTGIPAAVAIYTAISWGFTLAVGLFVFELVWNMGVMVYNTATGAEA